MMQATYIGQGVVEADEDGNGGEGGQAACQGVDTSLLIQDRRLLLDLLLVIPKACLDQV